ncbi:MAG: hypothetical protein K8S97_08965, partial [Anaerolineae bacterium]|nr:hypothetical protein [Anaerolineae bacterium]
LQARLKAAEARQLARMGRDTVDAGMLRQAFDVWQDACKLANAAHRERYEYEQRDVLKDWMELRVNHVLNRATALSDDIELATQEIHDELDSLSERYPNDVDILLWQAKVAFIIGQTSRSVEARREYFQKMRGYADSALRQARDDEVRKEARALKELANTGDQLSRQMKDIEDQMGRDSVQGVVRAWKIWSDLEPHISDDFELIRLWWERLCEQALERLNNGAGRDDEPVELEHIRALAMIYVLDPGNQRARQMFERLGELSDKLVVQAEEFVGDATKAERVMGKPEQKLSQQRQNARSLYEDMERVARLEVVLEDMGQAHRGILARVSQDLQPPLARLDEALRLLDQLTKAIEDIETQLDMEASDRNFSDSDRQLGALELQFRTHPAYKAIAERQRRMKEDMRALDVELDVIKGLISDERYYDAFRRMKQVDEETLDTFGRRYDFEFVAPGHGASYHGWDEVRAFVNDQAGDIDRIVEYAAPFAVSDMPALDIEQDKQDGVALVVNWPQVQNEIREALQQGQFVLARELLTIAIGNPNDQPEDKKEWSLLVALKRLEDPVYPRRVLDSDIAAATDVDSRYRLAMTYARESPLWKRVLQTLYTEHWPKYQDWLAEAEAMYGEIDDAEAQWREGWEKWKRAIHEIGGHITDVGGIKTRVGRRRRLGRRRRGVCSALDRAYEGYLDCRDVCPEHPRLLREMGDALWLYEQAKTSAGYDPEDEVFG